MIHNQTCDRLKSEGDGRCVNKQNGEHIFFMVRGESTYFFENALDLSTESKSEELLIIFQSILAL